VLEELKAINELVTAKATPQEAEAFRSWLLAAAQAAADAGKEGGSWAWRRAGERRGAADARAGARRPRDRLIDPGRARTRTSAVASPILCRWPVGSAWAVH
jgi:hypothetical protein